MLITRRKAQAQTDISTVKGRVTPSTDEVILLPRSLAGHSLTDDYEHSKWWVR
jgi:hypothetical protein